MEERVVGDYALGERIGSGSFSVVWRGWHRRTGETVAVKEIAKLQLSNKVKESLLKEISILKQVSHPNIVHLHQAIQTEERIFLVLEHCAGGDLWAYIQRHGRVSAATARHLLRQLASGLKVLREKNLIHRDLKPQNLLLSTNDETAVLKIGDFGFARYLMPEGFADTLCGSPLYMAPEIIQNRKYDAKADLWSVGAILFQLVTGKPPFDGNSQFQLFQNILSSNELRFPQDILSDLHPDCINLCRSLLRRNPVQRLTFEEFFNHKFLAVPRTSESPPEPVHNFDGNPSNSLHVRSSKTESRNRGILSMNAPRVTDSWESIEREYVLVNAHSTSMESPSLPETSVRDNSTTWLSSYTEKRVGKGTISSMQTGALVSSVCAAESTGSKASAALPVSEAFAASEVQKKTALQTGALDFSSVCGSESTGIKASTSLPVSQAFTASEAQKKPALHPAARLQLLHQYIYALTELAEEKLNFGSHLESFSIELVILAAWKEALQLCSSLMTSMPLVDSLHSLTLNDLPFLERGEGSSVNLEEGVDFRRPVSVCSWAEHGFVTACDRAEKISKCFGDIDGNMEMPDAAEIIFQAALSAGKTGAVEELMGHKERAVVLYSQAITLFRFIVEVATSLQLKPPILLSPANEQRIDKYIKSLRARILQSRTAKLPSKQTNDSPTK